MVEKVAAKPMKQEIAPRTIEEKIADFYGVRQTEEAVTFVSLYPRANSVQIAGDFNGWQPEKGIFNEKESDGVWFKALKLDPGAYQYRLVIDGEWRNDPNNPKYVVNEYGEKNSILTVR